MDFIIDLSFHNDKSLKDDDPVMWILMDYPFIDDAMGPTMALTHHCPCVRWPEFYKSREIIAEVHSWDIGLSKIKQPNIPWFEHDIAIGHSSFGGFFGYTGTLHVLTNFRGDIGSHTHTFRHQIWRAHTHTKSSSQKNWCQELYIIVLALIWFQVCAKFRHRRFCSKHEL